MTTRSAPSGFIVNVAVKYVSSLPFSPVATVPLIVPWFSIVPLFVSVPLPSPIVSLTSGSTTSVTSAATSSRSASAASFTACTVSFACAASSAAVRLS